MSKYTEIVERGTVIDEKTGQRYNTKTTMWPVDQYVPWIQTGKKGVLQWIGTKTPRDRVKRVIISEANAKNEVKLSAEEIADKAKVGLRTVTRVLSELTGEGLVKSAGHNQLMLNPFFYYAGKVYMKDKLQEQYDSIKTKTRKQSNLDYDDFEFEPEEEKEGD